MQTLANNPAFIAITGFPYKQRMIGVFDNRLLSGRFQEYQDKHFEHYDVSLVDDKQFLSYSLNAEFVFFWNIAACSFCLLAQLLDIEELNYPIVKGLVLSVSSSVEVTSQSAFDSLIAALQGNPRLVQLVCGSILKVVVQNKSREKFFIAGVRTVEALLKSGVLAVPDQQEFLRSVADEIIAQCAKTTSVPKVGSIADSRRAMPLQGAGRPGRP